MAGQIAGAVVDFFSTFKTIEEKKRGKLAKRLLASLMPRYGKWPPDYYMMWVLSLFAESDVWSKSTNFVRILRDHKSEIVRRSAALAIARNGNRSDGIEARERFSGSSPLERLAILLATKRLGKDERKHWKVSLQLTTPLEKKI